MSVNLEGKKLWRIFAPHLAQGRIPEFQAEGREFEPRLPLKIYERVPFLGTLFLCILENSDNFASL